MSQGNNSVLSQTIDTIFDSNEQGINSVKHYRKTHPNRKKKIDQKDLELALAVLLVDLASCDQEFDPREYQIISQGLRRIFGTTKDQVRELVNQANLTLANLRGTKRFGTMLKKNLDEDTKKVIMEVVNEVIAADGVEDAFETYLRHKFADFLGVSHEDAQPAQPIPKAE